MPVDASDNYSLPSNNWNPATPDALLKSEDLNEIWNDLVAHINTMMHNNGGTIALRIGGVVLGRIIVADGILRFRQDNSDGDSEIFFDPDPPSGSASLVNFLRNISTDGFKAVRIYRGNGSSEIDHEFSVGDAGGWKSFIGAHNGKLAVGKADPQYTLDLDGVDGVQLPRGTTVQRPTPQEGVIRYNTTLNQVEAYQGGAPGVAGAWFGLPFPNVFTHDADQMSWTDVSTGFVFKAGGLSVSDHPMPVTFDQPFPITCFSVVVMPFGSGGAARLCYLDEAPTPLGFSFYKILLSGAAATGSVRWMAIGW